MGDQQAQRLFAGVPTDAEVFERKRDLEEDLTPRMVVRAFVEAMLGDSMVERTALGAHVTIGARLLQAGVSAESPLRVLDICAGHGVWGSEFARFWVNSLRLHRDWLNVSAVELDPSKTDGLRRWADFVLEGDWHIAFDGRSYDLVLGNPAFSQAKAPEHPKGSFHPDESMVAVALPFCHAIALYMRQQSWTKTQAGYSVRLAYPPAMAWDLPNSVGHRGRSSGKDQVPYSLTLWRPGHEGPCMTSMLGPLPPEHLSWDTPPGLESDEFACAAGLPFAPSYSPSNNTIGER